jgi:hypothetical protein
MRLLNTSTLKIEEFLGNPPLYAVLSHTWYRLQVSLEELPLTDHRDEGEVLFNDIQSGTPQTKKGFEKITRCCALALMEGYQYVWIDTCCIDKSSSAELSEAINSMFAYYQRSARCFVHLDITISTGDMTVEDLQRARWTHRGW